MQTLTGVGVTLTRKLAGLGVRTVGDLVEYRPFRYEPAAPLRSLADVWLEGEEAVVEVTVLSRKSKRGRRATVIEARVKDASGEITAVWFNQLWLAEKLLEGTRLLLRGRVKNGQFQVKEQSIGARVELGGIAAVYSATEEVSVKRLRGLVALALPAAAFAGDPLPARLAADLELPRREDALVALHQPRDEAEGELSRRRLAFDELLRLQVGLARTRADGMRAEPLPPPGELLARYRAALPFELTPHQEHAIAEIDADLERARPMQRLLQGDVGSGKTVVALNALLRAVEVGRQGALMAPTETLAEQHFLTVEGICAELGVRCVLVTSALKAKERESVRAQLASGEAQIAIGTHALIQSDVAFHDLAVAVVDEQHRFGVEQRKALAEGRSPHVLLMTATPIPRTLALTLYADLDVSEIAQPPASRKPIVTSLITHERSSAAYQRLRRLLEEGRQAYVVCPLVEESATSQARAAEGEAERLAEAELKGFRIGCLHGRLKPEARRDIMRRFNAHEIDVLVATTVIEVGVDVPNATVMIVQEADRFGLAQLHQLRGRVGRGAEQSYCLLVARPKEELTDVARTRVEALVATSYGFELAEVDLSLRNKGQLIGTRQSGGSELRFTDWDVDLPLLERARELAPSLIDATGPFADSVDRFFADATVEA
ncbi:MAG: ATP-dependent helicase RecG [Gaiellaceae bacterium]|nr:ATP-dependent helicase RecG [Gaiellaceae bacterium]